MSKCLLCGDAGHVPIECPVAYEAYGTEFEFSKAVPCPLCAAGRRERIALARMDAKAARAYKRIYRGKHLGGWSSRVVLLKRFPPTIEHDRFGYSAANLFTLAVGLGPSEEAAIAEYLSELRRFIRQSGDPDTWPRNTE